MVDLTSGSNTYIVPTSKDGYMGPDVKVTANSESQAKQKVEQAGYNVNKHFPVEQVKR